MKKLKMITVMNLMVVVSTMTSAQAREMDSLCVAKSGHINGTTLRTEQLKKVLLYIKGNSSKLAVQIKALDVGSATVLENRALEAPVYVGEVDCNDRLRNGGRTELPCAWGKNLQVTFDQRGQDIYSNDNLPLKTKGFSAKARLTSQSHQVLSEMDFSCKIGI